MALKTESGNPVRITTDGSTYSVEVFLEGDWRVQEMRFSVDGSFPPAKTNLTEEELLQSLPVILDKKHLEDKRWPLPEEKLKNLFDRNPRSTYNIRID